jgi:hypothetical protein
VVAPAGAPATRPPTSATADAHIVSGTSQLAYAVSDEQGPQVQFIIANGGITAPPGATVVHVRADPTAPSDQPTNATIWGNVYRLTAMSDRGTAQIRPSSTTSIVLRAPVGPSPQPVLEYRDATGWRRLPATRVGNDIYSTPIAGVGDYAVAWLARPPSPRANRRYTGVAADAVARGRSEEKIERVGGVVDEIDAGTGRIDRQAEQRAGARRRP